MGRQTGRGPSFRVQLDVRIPLEAVLLNRAQGLPGRRRQEWLRGLLVQGFRAECGLLRQAAADEGSPMPSAFVRWLTSDTPRLPVAPSPGPKGVHPSSPVSTTAGKPFASLGRVMG